ncbi:hypothetical protein J6590_108360 [Homalodisca vitripennis]|nr:hypothetical protein J6590_108360 [Homalodisca vitripennis]
MPQLLQDHCFTIMYADDTTLLLNDKTTDKLAVTAYIALNMAYQYCHNNDLVVNPTKTNQVGFGHRNEDVPQIPGVTLESQVKFLGITLDNMLCWTPHIENLCKKLNTSVYAIKQIKAISDLATARTAYFALFETHLRYGLAVWGAASAENIEKILVIQKKAVRTLAGLQRLDSCREAFKSLNILTIVGLYIKEVVMYVDGEDLLRGSDLHTYCTRNANLYNLPAHRLTQYEKKTTYKGAKFFNRLPRDIRTGSGSKLKSRLHSWLAERPFYSINEFLQHD